MRPHLLPDFVPDLRTDRSSSPGRRVFQVGVLAASVAAVTLASPGWTCPVTIPDRSDTVELDLAPPEKTRVTVDYFDAVETPELSRPASCNVWVTMRLSAFPSASNRMTTGQLAHELERKIASEVPVECTLLIEYTDDIGAGLARHELCVMASYTFQDGRAISSAREDFCMGPEEWAEIDAMLEENERRRAESLESTEGSDDELLFELAY